MTIAGESIVSPLEKVVHSDISKAIGFKVLDQVAENIEARELEEVDFCYQSVYGEMINTLSDHKKLAKKGNWEDEDLALRDEGAVANFVQQAFQGYDKKKVMRYLDKKKLTSNQLKDQLINSVLEAIASSQGQNQQDPDQIRPEDLTKAAEQLYLHVK